MPVLSDEDWAVLTSALDRIRSARGGRFCDERRTLEAVIWRMLHGRSWRDVPPEVGPSGQAAQLYIRWSNDRTLRQLREELRHLGRPDPAEVFLDRLTLRAYERATRAERRFG